MTQDTRRGVYVADGWGIKIHVNHKHLVVEDGIGPERRVSRFHKATANLTRLVILGATGYLTFDAVRWLADAKIPYFHLDTDGTVLATSATMGVDRAKLRRAQALAANNNTGKEITRKLLHQKILGQAHLAGRLSKPVETEIVDHLPRLDTATKPDGFLIIEASAANTYWQAWTDLPVRFAKADQTKIPDHWRTFGNRSSPITGATRRAANPANAILNYLYALLEAETRIAIATAGLDPGIGILHADQPHRDNLALDIMEAARPDVDTYLLDLLQSHTFRAIDFTETNRGVCRVRSPLNHVLAATTTTWAQMIGPVVESVVRALGKTHGQELDRIPTPLTQTNRSRGRDNQRRKQPTQQRPSLSTPDDNCFECGATIEPGRKRCNPCNDRYQQDRFAQLHEQHLNTLSQLRKQGADPAHGDEAARKRGNSNRQHQDAIVGWTSDGQPTDLEFFRDEILPHLPHLSLTQMMRATGLSSGYCSMIRRGDRIPHPRHWGSLLATCREAQTCQDQQTPDLIDK